MKKRNLLEDAAIPGGGRLTLYEHDGEYYIYVDGEELMSTRRHHSEEKLAEFACHELRKTPECRVLIGGLGCGYTLRAATKILPSDAHILVSEIIPAVVGWNRNPDYPFAGDALADPRVEVATRDVFAILKASRGVFDAIILDVDNGAAAMSVKSNASIYRRDGVLTARDALRPKGCLVYWSAGEDKDFEKILRSCSLTVSGSKVRAHPSSGPWHWLYRATRIGSPEKETSGRAKPGN